MSDEPDPKNNEEEPIMAKKSTAKKAEAKTTEMSSTELIKLHGSKSAAIRALAAEGYKTAEIARKLGIIYQHARNVLQRPLKRKATKAS